MKISFFQFSIPLLLMMILFGSIIHAQETPIGAIHASSVAEGLQSPVRIAIDNQDIIYVTDASQKCIAKYDVSGKLLGKIVPGGLPISIAINGENQIFIGDGETGNILKLDGNGVTTGFYTGTGFPSSMVVSPDNLLYVVDSKFKQVVVLDPSGNVVRTFGSDILVLPTGIAYDEDNSRVLVAEHGGIGTGFKPVVKVREFDLQGNLISSFGSHGKGDGKFYRIQGMAVGKCGKRYVTDPFQATISVFNQTGFIEKFGEYGNKSGQLNAPMDIVIDSREQIWVTSMNNSSLEVYNINETNPTSSITSLKTLICTGDSTEITIDFTGKAPWTFTYTVNGVNPVTVSNTTENPYTLTVSEAGLYEVTALSDSIYAGTCFTGSVNISLNPLPTINLGGDINICKGETSTLDAGASFISYLWNDGSTNQTLDVSTSGNYSVTASDGNGCKNSDEINVSVNPLPIVNLGEDVDICEGETSALDAGASFVSYLWNDGSTNQTLDVSKSGNYSVTASDENGCKNSDEISVFVNPLPIVNLGEDVDICEGETSTLDAGSSFISYLWNDGSMNQTLEVSKSGNYSITVSDRNGCENSDEISVSANPLPFPEFTYTENYLEVSFSNNSTNAVSYFWDFDDNETSEEINPVHVYKTTGEYEVVLTASNQNCGDREFSKTINILETMVEGMESENFPKIYPNPSSGIITIEMNKPVQSQSGLRIEITNITGQKVYSKAFDTQKKADQINLSSFPNGIYTVKLISKDMIKTDKILLLNKN